MISTSPPRARHISDLEIVLPSTPAYPGQIKAAITDPLTELLNQTLKIRRLVLHGYFISHIDEDVCVAIAGALRAMSRLAELSIKHLYDAVLPVCASLPLSLRKLSLGFMRREWNGWLHTYDPLIKILASLPCLHTLELCRFWPRKMYSNSSPKLPSLRNLTFRDVSVRAMDLVSLAPNLQQVSVTSQLQREAWDAEPAETWSEPPRPWPPIRRLEFNVMSTLSPFLDALSPPADYLKITARTPLSRAPELISVFRKLSPVGADLFLTVGEDPASFWREVADAAPRLRYLRLSLTVKNSSDSWTSWMNDLATSLSAIPLVYLKLRPHLKVRKTDLQKNATHASKQKSKRETLLDLERERTREMISEASALLPHLLADAIPTLSFFELGARMQT
ncbi:hypothetical protein L227DRAFT_655044 [Lentinus tigrinus ALCF2SS1-6]|uniref:F-box domain-containing protein n=1 Tax=Lentinus tigrinus ALCF2SS1-6 TaxID=1328759 RepID=A0A5C2S366_9APHY|nr:hypothetical protein L227DRAFT_655044 [Lentinus tigrinus ALCF2SS1-6]